MHPKDFKALIKECVLDVLKENLSSDKVSIVNKYKEAIYSQLEALKFRRMGNTPRDYMEYYKYNFATVQVSVDVQSNTVRFEKFFDNELLADNNFVKELPLPTNIFSDDLVHSIVNFSKKLKTNIDHDYPIFGGIDEAFDPTSVGPNPEASEGQSVDNPYAAWNAKNAYHGRKSR